MIMKICTILLLVVATTTALEIPSGFKLCKKSDPNLPECLKSAAKAALSVLAGGLKDFKILPIEPLAINKLNIGAKGGPVSINQEYRDILLYGLSKGLQITSFDMDNKMMKINALTDNVQLISNYKYSGNILILPIEGEGKCNITIYNLVSKHHINFEKFQKNGETYIKATKYVCKLSTGPISIQLDNFLSGNPELGKRMATIINENSEAVFNEAKPAVEEAFGQIYIGIFNNLFTRIPMNKIFLE